MQWAQTVAYCTGNVPSMIFFVGPINGIVVSMVLYIVLKLAFRSKTIAPAAE